MIVIGSENADCIVEQHGVDLAVFECHLHIGLGAEILEFLYARSLAFDQVLKRRAGEHADGLAVQIREFGILGLGHLLGGYRCRDCCKQAEHQGGQDAQGSASVIRFARK